MPHPELNESVLVVPRQVIDRLCPGVFCPNAALAEAEVLQRSFFLDRAVAEHDFRHKQVIPYVVIRHGDCFLLLRRTRKQAESRLHDLYSLGIGGHVNSGDKPPPGANVLLAGMRRELEEEIHVAAEESCRLVGLINDDSNEVSRVHMGFLYLLTAASPQYTLRETDKHTALWGTPAEIGAYYERMESWAQIVYDFVVCAGDAQRAKRWRAGA
jgi:predicted NUDIX family phosphoesterase